MNAEDIVGVIGFGLSSFAFGWCLGYSTKLYRKFSDQI